MTHTETKGNLIYTYEVEITDRELIEDILSDIVLNTSYTIPLKEHKLPCDTLGISIKDELEKTLPDNSTPIYTDVTLTDKTVTSDVTDEKIRPQGHPIIIAVKRVAPKLAYIVRDILDGKNDSIERFIAYENDSEMVDIDERISSAENAKDIIREYHAISEENIKAQKSVYDMAFNLKEMKEAGEVFNTESLRILYYQIAKACTIKLINISGNGFLNVPVTSRPSQPLTSMLTNAFDTRTYGL